MNLLDLLRQIEALSKEYLSRSSDENHKANRKPRKSRQKKFPLYLSVQEAGDGLKKKELVKGIIRINANNASKAYVSNEEHFQEDYLITCEVDRNRALEGDVVAIKFKPESEWTKYKKTAQVVHIVERIHSRYTIGFLELMPDRNKHFALLIPRDSRIPRIRIPATDCPTSFHEDPTKYENKLFKAKITSWTDMRYAHGTIIETIGIAGDLQSETTALLIENGLDVNVASFPDELTQSLLLTDDIPPSEFLYREDFRKECVVIITSSIAHDLAVSCKELTNGNLEIGIHIPDVSYYLKEGTPLDKFVSRRGRTIRLINKTFPMLPQELYQKCLLVPGVDKLAMSVLWEMTKCGEIIQHRFSRSIINACVVLSNNHAQMMIIDPNQEIEDLPMILSRFTCKDLSSIVNYMHLIAINLRAERFRNGALDIEEKKLIFKLSTGEPQEYAMRETTEPDKLLEEFTLLSNMFVGRRIYNDFPELAFMLCQDSPNQRLLLELKKSLEVYGIELDVSTSNILQESISGQHFRHLQMVVINHLIAKLMPAAQYVCAKNINCDDEPVDTHFTSPFERYADIIVHRFLAASLGYYKKRHWKIRYLTAVANNCNQKEYNSKQALEASSNLYLAQYIEQHQPFIEDAVVVDVQKNSFDVLVLAIGSRIRMYPRTFGDDVKCIQEQMKTQKKLQIVLPETNERPEASYIIQLFSVLKVSVFRIPKTSKLEAKLFYS